MKTPENRKQTQTKTAITNDHKEEHQTIRFPLRLVPAGAQDQNPPAKRSETFYIATLNTRTLRKQESLLDLEEVLPSVRQGDPLSPKLFNAVLEYAFRRLNWKNYGININGNPLNHLRFTDDTLLLEKTPKN
ncbi:Retrovirus-related Pol polyprotein from type-1 retrotransposable element R2 [Eumeta japonica]|uniref:Retrovirus-related Pol polyprotein from type-1 retrotransposable element R2 n=1 Tax=Eumeta variegata TaxID=151549 RepID=A0A4C1UG52_EUMVA|nr:Retrovirus-related Pol polyprotein from type-1 retrotransposable element R2 [Eumeta japonica]